MKKISVIVPVYNVQEYIGKCLESLVTQTLKDIEIICINDGSTDDSLMILQNFAAKDKRIKVINKENGGVSSARNAGLKVATGEYVMFVDGDDRIEKQTCSKCYEKIVADNADLLIFNYVEIKRSADVYISPILSDIKEEKFRFTDCPSDFFYILTGVWGKLFKNKKLPVFDTNIKKGEDTAFFWEYCLENNPIISILNEPLYFYQIRVDSAMHQEANVINGDIFKSAFKISDMSVFQKSDIRIQAFIMDRYAQSLWWEVKNTNVKLDKKYYEICLKFLHKTEEYNKLYNLQYYNKFKNIIFTNKYFFNTALFNPIRFYQEPRHNVIQCFGISLKIKRRCGRLGAEHYYINQVRKNYKKYPKDTYLLFDCLHDATVESIDAYSLFEQMREQNIPAYYVIRKQSELYKKLQEENKLENIIALNFSSRTHPNEFMQKIYEVLLRTKCIITSFGENSGTTEMFFRRHSSWQYVFIQHGPSYMKESVLYNGYLYPEKFDKFLVCSDREEKLFLKYGFPQEKLIKVGLPRWDFLQNLTAPTEKSILLMLTWRHLNVVDFENSLYKKNLLSLLHNKKLINYLRENKIKLYFAPHHALLNNMRINFDLSQETSVEIINSNKISQYIRQCSCLITDFSSVAFDFMFQHKPVIFYMLDKTDSLLNRFDKEDLAKFDYKQYILPNVLYDEQKVVKRLIEYCENNFEINHTTQQIYDTFFYTRENIREKLIEKLEQICLTQQTDKST